MATQVVLPQNADDTHPCTKCLTLSREERKKRGMNQWYVSELQNCTNFCKEYEKWKKAS